MMSSRRLQLLIAKHELRTGSFVSSVNILCSDCKVTSRFKLHHVRALHTSRRLNSELHAAAAKGDIDRIQRLSECHASVNLRDGRGWSALMHAARHNQAPALETLMQKGCDPTIRCYSGHSALEIAQFWDNVDCTRLLKSSIQGNEQPVKADHSFTGGPLIRASHIRNQVKSMRELRSRSDAKYLLSHQNKLIVKSSVTRSRSGRDRTVQQLWYIPPTELTELGAENLDPIFLGFYPKLNETSSSDCDIDADSCDGSPVFVLPVGDAVKDGVLSQHADAQLSDHRQFLLSLGEEDGAVAAHAMGMADWNWRYQFCATCGSTTVMQDSGYKRACTNSSCVSARSVRNTSYPRTDSSIISAVESPDRSHTLLIRMKGMMPNMVSCVSGYIEPGESLEDSCVREVYEETGVTLRHARYHSSQFWPTTCVLMLGFLATAHNTTLKLDASEVVSGRWFSRHEAAEALTMTHPERIITPPRQAIAHHLVKAWLIDTSSQ